MEYETIETLAKYRIEKAEETLKTARELIELAKKYMIDKCC